MVSHYGKPTEITATKLCLLCLLFLFFIFIFAADMHSDGEGNTPQRRGVGSVGDCSYVMQDTMSGRHTAHCGDEGFLTNML